MRRLLALVLAGGLAAGLAACQAIPREGPVQEGLKSLNQGEPPVQFNPDGPAPGATQEEIVRGFVRAATSSTDDYAIAREFLTPEWSAQWQPGAGVFVDPGTQSYESVSDTAGVLSLSGLATVDAIGTLTPGVPGEQTQVTFEFAQVNGEWRLATTPQGIILDRTSFGTLWSARQLYFLTPDNRLVPETRWFLNRQTQTTQIVGELLAGPTDANSTAMRTAFPAGTTLASNAAPIVDGTVRIEFSPELLTADPNNLRLVESQLAATLQSVAGVTHFQIMVSGAAVDLLPVAAVDTEGRDNAAAGVVVLRDGVFGTITAGKVTPLPGIGLRVAQLRPDAVTLSDDRRSAVVRHTQNGKRVVSWVSANELVTLDVRDKLLAPDLDRFGYVWSYSSAHRDKILTQLPGRPAEILDLPPLGAVTPKAVRMSPGGNRLAMLAEDDLGRSVILTMAVVRGDDGRPTGLAPQANTAMIVEGAPVDLDWMDEMHLVGLNQAGSTVHAFTMMLGDLPVDAGTVVGAVEIYGGTGGKRSQIRLLDEGGQMYAPQGSGWQPQLGGVSLIATGG